jgi:hypothetical protein
MCTLERESILEQNGQGSRAAQCLERRVLEDSQSRRHLTIATGTKQLQTNK